MALEGPADSFHHNTDCCGVSGDSEPRNWLLGHKLFLVTSDAGVHEAARRSAAPWCARAGHATEAAPQCFSSWTFQETASDHAEALPLARSLATVLRPSSGGFLSFRLVGWGPGAARELGFTGHRHPEALKKTFAARGVEIYGPGLTPAS